MRDGSKPNSDRRGAGTKGHEADDRIFDEIFAEEGPESSGVTNTVPPVARDHDLGPPGNESGPSGDGGGDLSVTVRGIGDRSSSTAAPELRASNEQAKPGGLRAALGNVSGRLTQVIMGALDGGQSSGVGSAVEEPRHGWQEAAGFPPLSGDQSPDELESRLKVSLRETSVGNIARVCVGSPKGGVGKSSMAYAIAGSVAYYTNMRVCLVDADPNFGATRLLVPRPIDHSVVSLARDADELRGLSDLRGYVAQNEHMRLDVVLGPEHAYEMASFEDLGAAYESIDEVLSRYYDLIIYDLGLGFRDPAIRSVLALCNELLFVTDSEVIPNAMLADGITYVENLGVDLGRTTLVLNHRLPPADESAETQRVRAAHANLLRRVTEVPYDPSMSQLLNTRSFHIEALSQNTRLGILTTLAASLEGLRSSAYSGQRVSETLDESRSLGAKPRNHKNKGR